MPIGSVLAILVALFVGIAYFVPELEDFRSPLYLGFSEKKSFDQVAEGLFKNDLPWHMTPFHEEVLDIFLIKSKGGWCLRYPTSRISQP